MSVNVYNKTQEKLINVGGGSGSLEFTGTKAEWEALTTEEKARYDGKKVNITDDALWEAGVCSAWENITDDCIITFGGSSGGSTKTDYVLYNKYLRKYRYKGTFIMGHDVSRTIKVTDSNAHANMSDAFVACCLRGLDSGSLTGCEVGTLVKSSNSVTVSFYNRNEDNDWGSCSLLFEIDCSYSA